jgi:hypothetical protein
VRFILQPVLIIMINLLSLSGCSTGGNYYYSDTSYVISDEDFGYVYTYPSSYRYYPYHDNYYPPFHGLYPKQPLSGFRDVIGSVNLH